MVATLEAVVTQLSSNMSTGVSRRPKKPTRTVRLHEDVADLIEKLAPIFGESAPDFASNKLRLILEPLREQAAKMLLGQHERKKRQAE